METTKQFQILLRRQIPYISEGVWAILAVLFCIMFLFYLFMLPAKGSSDEMSTAYYILVIPEWLKRLSVVGIIGLIIFSPLYFVARLKKPALLTLTDVALLIKGKQLELTIPFRSIKRIYFNDLKNIWKQPKEKIQIVIQQKGDKLTTFLLANYEEAGLALEVLSKIQNAEFGFYDDNMATMHDDE